MIVKDEAALITGTINSVKGSVDRYCILDTGSKDDTINLIQRAFQGIPGKVGLANVIHSRCIKNPLWIFQQLGIVS